MSRAAFGLLWSFVFVLPWEEVVQLPVLGSIPHLVGVVALAVGVLNVLARGRIRPPASFHMLALGFVLWAGASGFWSIDGEATRDRFLTYLQLVVLVWLIWEIAWSPERQRALLQAYVLGACVAAAGTLYNYQAGIALDAQATRFSTFHSNPNELGLALVTGLPMAWYLGLSEPRRPFGRVWQLYLPLGLTAILLTASRGAFVAALVALLIIPWTLGQLRIRAKAALCVLAVASLVLATHVAPTTSLERIASTRSDIVDGHFGGRGAIWKAGLQVVREHPLVGVGAGAFPAAVEPTLRVPWTSHETFLAVLAEDGILGLLLFLAMAAATMQPLRHLPVRQRRFSIVLLATLAVGSLSGAWDYSKELWFVLGLLAAQSAPRPERRTTWRPAAALVSPDRPAELLPATSGPC